MIFAQSLFAFLMPEQASTAAERVDRLLYFLVAVTGTMAVLIAAVIVFFSVKYRRRPGNVQTPKVKSAAALEIFWTVVPLVIFLVIFVWSASIYFYMTRSPAGIPEIYVVGKQWMWKIQHPEGQREINELHVPVGQPVRLKLISEDAIHDFFVPAFRIKVDVLPNRFVYTWFTATKTGTYRFFCSQYCGTGHSSMIGQVVVMEPAEYEAWLRGSAEGSLAVEGRKVFLEYQCVACHTADALARGPVLEGLYNQPVRLTSGRTAIADDTYLHESIVDPGAKIVAGYEDIMPSFKGQIPEEKLIALIAMIKSLGSGQTPRRIEHAPAPVSQPAPAASSSSRLPSGSSGGPPGRRDLSAFSSLPTGKAR